jgi:hypothetical protein
METVVAKPVGGETLERRRPARSSESAGSAEPDVVEEYYEHVRRAFGWE